MLSIIFHLVYTPLDVNRFGMWYLMAVRIQDTRQALCKKISSGKSEHEQTHTHTCIYTQIHCLELSGISQETGQLSRLRQGERKGTTSCDQIPTVTQM